MEELKELYESMNFKDVRIYIQSGNVVFQCQDSPAPELVKKIEKKIKEVLGFDVLVLIRTKNEFKGIIENNPFKNADNSKLHVTFLSDAPSEKPIEELNYVKDKSEEFSISEKEIYLFCPNGYGRTKLSNDLLEKILKVSATTRNWRTVNKLFEIAK